MFNWFPLWKAQKAVQVKKLTAVIRNNIFLKEQLIISKSLGRANLLLLFAAGEEQTDDFFMCFGAGEEGEHDL